MSCLGVVVSRRRPRSLRAGLRASRLSSTRLFAYGIGAVTPLTVIVGGLSLGFGQVRQLGTPVGYMLAAAVLAVFAVGLAAMARHVPNSGAFYSYVAAGLGKPLGAATALIALIAYTALQIGLYGAFGPAADHALRLAGIREWWSLWALLGWAAITLLGQLRLRTNALIIGALVTAEIAFVVAVDVVMLAHPAGGVMHLDALNPMLLASPTGVASLVGAITGLVGFEVPLAFALVAVNPRTTVSRAIQAILLVVAILYGGTGLVMSVVAGPDAIIAVASQHTTDLFFYLASAYLPAWVIQIGLVLYATSLFAATLAFYSTVGRYTLTLAREGFLPRWLAITRADEVPVTAGVLQSGLALIVLVIVADAGLDPMMDLFFFGTVSGGLGVLILMTLAALAVIAFFRRRQHAENWARRRLAPILSAVFLTVITAASIAFFGDLLGTTNPVKTWVTPITYTVAAVAGILWARRLKAARPQVYAAIGHGGNDTPLDPLPAVPRAAPAAT
jgi:amino acid transporter